MACLDPDTVLAFVDGRLKGADLVAAEEHVAGCRVCEEMVTLAVSGQPSPGSHNANPLDALPRGAAFGRYVVLRLAGRGAMGAVYEAYDTRLECKIALKLLREQAVATPRSDATARLLDEAKKLARISHQNVIAVRDAGQIEGRVFISMEFVDGETLSAWLQAKPRSWRQIREIFVAAGRGLEAAHQAGLVHRDFKPQNVMVGKEGAVRVTDFGLASDFQSKAGEVETALAALEGELSEHTVALTQTGLLIGTPLYMAPEQFEGEPAGARSDQFSFCVALYHALYGEWPFPVPVASFRVLREAVRAGRLREPPPRSQVPTWLRRILVRGLDVDPSRRFPSMAELLGALEYRPARRYQRFAVGSAVTALLLAGAMVARLSPGRAPGACTGGGARLVGVWDSGRRASAARAFLATGQPLAEQSFERVASIIDDYASRWVAGDRDACEATNVRREQSEAVLDLRMSCLAGELASLRTLVDVLETVDAETIRQSVTAARALPSPTRCADLTLLQTGVALPDSPEQRRRIDDAGVQLAAAKVLSSAGRHAEAKAQALAALGTAQATGYAPLIADTLHTLGSLENWTGATKEGAREQQAAFYTALGARRDDIALESATALEMAYGYHLENLQEADRWDQLAAALLRRVGTGHEREAIELSKVRALRDERRGHFAEALRSVEGSLAPRMSDLPADRFELGDAWNMIACERLELEDYRGALVAIDKSLEIFRRLDPDNPNLASFLSNRGEILQALGRHTEARAMFDESLARWTRWLPPDHPWLAYPLTGIGNVLRSEGHADAAVPVLERALALRAGDVQDGVRLAETRFALARALWDARVNRARARSLALQAREGYLAAGWTARAGHVNDWLAQPGEAREATVASRTAH